MKKRPTDFWNWRNARAGTTSPEDARRVSERDYQFHRALLKLGGNPILETYSELLQIFFQGSMDLTEDALARSAVSSSEHRMIAEALKNGETELAKGMMRHHLERYKTPTNGKGKK